MIGPSSRRALLATLMALAPVACKKKAPPQSRPPADAPLPTLGAPEPLPGGDPGGAIGAQGKARFVGAADDGGWVLFCEPWRAGRERLRVVVGDGPGLPVNWVVAATDRDLIVIDGEALLHVDAVARTSRRLGPAAAVAIDGDSRRLVQADGSKVIVRDPGLAPRAVETGGEIAELSLRGKRWLGVRHGSPPKVNEYASCGWFDRYGNGQPDATIDLDPSGLEAPDRIGPQLAITGAGEVTLDGVRVAGAECVAHVTAALADPPRALLQCNDRNHVVGPGFDHVVGGGTGGPREQATIAEGLILGRRVVCPSGACIDLKTGRDFGTYDTPVVWVDDARIVRKQAGNLVIDDLDQERQREVVLPRLTQAVTIDTATGRRVAGAAPTTPAYVDSAGHFLLYGRHVVDLEAATLVATLGEDALAIDRSGRVLVASAVEQGPLRWRKP